MHRRYATKYQGTKSNKKGTPCYGRQEYCTLFRIDKRARPSLKLLAKIVNPIASAASTSVHKSDSTVMDSSMCCRVCCRGNHVTWECRHLKRDNRFVRANSWKHEARFWCTVTTKCRRSTMTIATYCLLKKIRTYRETFAKEKWLVQYATFLATVRYEIGRTQSPQLIGRWTMHPARDLRPTVIAPSGKTNHWWCRDRSPWMQRLSHQNRDCTEDHQKRKSEKAKAPDQTKR